MADLIPDPAPPWLVAARSQIGVSEKPGREHESRILEYHSTTTLRATADEIPWCSSFVNWCIRKAGIVGTNSAAARSWLDWGEQLTMPRYGCVVVMRRGLDNKSGHVGFWLDWVGPGKQSIRVLGGNQSNKVCGAVFRSASVLGYRWPSGFDVEQA